MTFQKGDTLSVGWRHKRGYPHLGWRHERGIPPDVGWCHERRDTRRWKSSVLQNRKWLLINYVELFFAVILYNSLLFSFYAKEKKEGSLQVGWQTLSKPRISKKAPFTSQNYRCICAAFETRLSLPKVIWRGTKSSLIVNVPAFPVQYATTHERINPQ